MAWTLTPKHTPDRFYVATVMTERCYKFLVWTGSVHVEPRPDKPEGNFHGQFSCNLTGFDLKPVSRTKTCFFRSSEGNEERRDDVCKVK